MRRGKTSKILGYSIFGLNFLYFDILVVAVSFKAYRFFDFTFAFVFLLIGIAISLLLSLGLMSKLKNSGIEISEKIGVFILIQTPSTLMFVLTMIMVLLSQIDID